MSALKYSYHEERGEFHGYVEDEMGNVIYEMHYPEFYEDDETGELIESSTIFEDGFMQDADDTEGLRKYLLSMRLINEDDEVIHESEYKSTYNDGGLTSGAYGQGTSLLEEGGEMDIEEEDKEENEIEEHLQSISDDTGIPVDVLKSYADEIGTDYMDLTNDIPYNGAFGTQEDFAEHLVDNGLITDLSSYLYMTDTDIRILAGEEADARLDGMDDEDVAELAGKSDEYEELKEDLERLEELKDEIEELEEEIKEMRDEFDTDDATEEETENFDEKIKDKENELADLKDENETLGNRVEYASIEDFIDDIRDDALSNANDEITEELEKDAVGYFENLGYSQQDLANHSLFSIDYDKLADDVSYDYIFIEGEDGDYHIFNNYADGGAIPEGYHQMPDGTIMPDSAHLEHGGDVAESNLHMLMNQAEQFEHHAKELQEALSKNPRVDAWVVAKAERAATDLSDITHYLEGVNNTHSDSDGEDVIKMDVPLFIRSQEYAREDAKSDADLHEFTDNAIDLSQSGETLEMDDYNKLVPNHMARGGVNFGASFDKLKKEILDPNIYSPRDLKVGETYEWTIGAEPLKVKYLGLADENEDKKAGSSRGKGFLFEWVHDAGKYVELGRYSINQILRKITGYAKGGLTLDDLYRFNIRFLEENVNKLYGENGSLSRLFPPVGVSELEVRFAMYQFVDYQKITNKKELKGDMSPIIRDIMLYNRGTKKGLEHQKIINDIFSKVKKEDGGEMARGGKVSSFFSKAKEKYVQAKDYTKKQIKDKKKQIALEVIDNTKDKVSGNKQKMLLKSVEQIVEDNYARGGATFDDKVKAISSSLTGKEVPKRLRKDYGKKYNKKEALEAARRIAGSMRAKEMKKGKK